MRNLVCPVCAKPLEQTPDNKSLTCDQGHLFDKAKQGYLTLLLSHHKKSKQPGDTTEMVASRTRFLNKGYYEPVCEALIQFIATHLSLDSLADSNNRNTQTYHYTDIACGEGYYTQNIHTHLNKTLQTTSTGFDISTPAIKAAARRDKSMQWLVASASHIPMAAASQDLLTCLFCRTDFEQAAKIAKPDALFVVAETGPNHLIELREHLYDEIKPEKEKAPTDSSSTFKLIDKRELSTTLTIGSAEDIMDLLTMTPHYWRAKPDKKAALAQLDHLNVTIDIRFMLFRNEV